MRDSLWNISLGHWGGVHVRLHASFLAFGVCTLFLSSQAPDGGMIGYGALSLLALLLAVVLHELAHAAVAVRLGGVVEEIVLSPLGGLVPPIVPAHHACQLLTTIAGPAANLTLVVITAIPIALLTDGLSLIGLMNPLAPRAALQGPLGLVALKLFFWVNWLLVIVNALPASPLDGGRALKAILSPALGTRRAVFAVAGVARVVAVALFVAALLLRNETATFGVDPAALSPPVTIPLWIPLVLLSLTLFFSATVEIEKVRERRGGDDLVGYDFTQGLSEYETAADEDDERPRPGPLRRWLDRRRREREQQQQLLEEEEDCRVDDILIRLHQFGPDALSADDRALLERASARYRDRLHKTAE